MVRLTGTCSVYVSVYAEARRVWENPLPGKFDASEATLGPKTSLLIFALYSRGMVTGFRTSRLRARMEISVHQQFQAPRNCVKEQRTQAGQNFSDLSYSKQRWPRMCGTTLKICSFSGLCMLFYVLCRRIQ